MFQIDLTENLHTFFYATEIPVIVLKNGKIERSLPESFQTAQTVAGGKAEFCVNYNRMDYNAVQYITSSYGERFLIYVIDDTCTVAAGPVLTEPMRSGALDHLLQNKKISIKLKPRLEQYYNGLKLVSSQTYYYCGKLVSRLFSYGNLKASKEVSPMEYQVGFIQNYFQNTYRNREKMFTHPPYFLEKRLVKQIQTCDEKGALSTLNEINMLNRAVLSSDSMRSLKNSIICSCTFFTRAVIDAGVFPDIAFTYSDTFIQEIEKMNTMAEVRNYEQEIVRKFVKLVRENNSKDYSIPVFNAMQYLINNLSQKLSLAEIAKHAYVHPNYLSGLFKKETGCSITEFISRQRIEESTYFVAYTDFEIADISNFYHFCNQSYFSTLFKRYLSVSPNDYRKRHKK
ncbi:MAG: AraC family transcriptional regulator [Oscillospiraceae bacterium]|jgi:YesN/AraC family two-component response regulator|nr:AraC family transcriptional regulator [Oscillospiraceae bacterium]